jgi:hypothetical protein
MIPKFFTHYIRDPPGAFTIEEAMPLREALGYLTLDKNRLYRFLYWLQEMAGICHQSTNLKQFEASGLLDDLWTSYMSVFRKWAMGQATYTMTLTEDRDAQVSHFMRQFLEKTHQILEEIWKD